MRFRDSDNLVSLNWPLAKAIKLRHCIGVEQHIVRRLYECKAPRRYELKFSAHSVTHFDLPWALPPVSTHTMIPSLDKPKAATLLRAYMEPFWEEAVVLDFRNRVKLVEKLEDKRSGLLKWNKPEPDHILSVLEKLKISLEDIKRAVGGNLDKLRGKLVLIWTGWIPRFVPRDLYCDHPFYEGMHPFLVHPFLSTNAARSLVDRDCVGVAGVCSDTSNLEFPLDFISPTGSLEAFFTARDVAQKKHSNLCEVGVDGKPQQVLHVAVLSRNLRLGELFDFSGLSGMMGPNKKACFGELLMVPLPISAMNDAIFGQVYFLASTKTEEEL